MLWLAIAAFVVILGQLAALVWVVEAQVQQGHERRAQWNSPMSISTASNGFAADAEPCREEPNGAATRRCKSRQTLQLASSGQSQTTTSKAQPTMAAAPSGGPAMAQVANRQSDYRALMNTSFARN